MLSSVSELGPYPDLHGSAFKTAGMVADQVLGAVRGLEADRGLEAVFVLGLSTLVEF